MENTHSAWRFFTATGEVAYVESISDTWYKCDRYSYTSKAEKALLMTEEQCKAFCQYMKECGTVGFWS